VVAQHDHEGSDLVLSNRPDGKIALEGDLAEFSPAL
jgi:hypothetical protein